MTTLDDQNKRSFLIWGAGGHSKVVGDLVRSLGHRVVGHVALEEVGREVGATGAEIVISQEDFLEHLDRNDEGELPFGADSMAVAIGDNAIRLRFVQKFSREVCPPLVHPSALVSTSATLASGTVVFPNAVVNADADLGEAVIVNTGAVVEHDCHIGTASHLSPNATISGESSVGEHCWIGAGATVIHGVHIGRSTTIGAGAVVISDIPQGVTAVGNPVRILEEESS